MNLGLLGLGQRFPHGKLSPQIYTLSLYLSQDYQQGYYPWLEWQKSTFLTSLMLTWWGQCHFLLLPSLKPACSSARSFSAVVLTWFCIQARGRTGLWTSKIGLVTFTQNGSSGGPCQLLSVHVTTLITSTSKGMTEWLIMQSSHFILYKFHALLHF